MWIIETKDGVIEDALGAGIKELLYTFADDSAAEIMVDKLNNVPWSTPTITDVWFFGKKDRPFPKHVAAAQKFLDEAIADDLYLLEDEIDDRPYSYM